MRPLWKELPITRDFLYITFRVPSKGDPLRVPLTEPPYREMLISTALLQLSL